MTTWPDTMKVAPIGEWRTCVGFPDYEVSRSGEVRRVTGHRGKPPIGVLKLATQPNGYRAVNLYRGGVSKRRTVHTLVWDAFGEEPRDGDIEVNHKDGDKSNNALSNLELKTSAGNKEHASATSLSAFGDRNAATKLSEKEVQVIRDAYAAGNVSQRSLAESFGVSQGHVSDIITGRRRKRLAQSRGGGLL